MASGSDATAAAYVEATDESGANVVWGVGLDPNILTASLKAVVSAVSRLDLKRGEAKVAAGDLD